MLFLPRRRLRLRDLLNIPCECPHLAQRRWPPPVTRKRLAAARLLFILIFAIDRYPVRFADPASVGRRPNRREAVSNRAECEGAGVYSWRLPLSSNQGRGRRVGEGEQGTRNKGQGTMGTETIHVAG